MRATLASVVETTERKGAALRFAHPTAPIVPRRNYGAGDASGLPFSTM
jgi:hypothetical protein